VIRVPPYARRALDRGPPGGGRFLGRDPAADGLLHDRLGPAGLSLDHPVIAAALRGLDAFAVDDESGRRIEACQSPVWDTALAVTALLDAGTAHDDPSIKMARTGSCKEK